MGVKIYDTLEPQGGYPAVTAENVQMPDGSRLSAFMPVFPVLPGVDQLEPEKFYDFGAVAKLDVTLVEKNDGNAHEYCFRFRPEEGFSGLTITPEVSWVSEPQYPVGKTCLVGVYMGMAVMGIA